MPRAIRVIAFAGTLALAAGLALSAAQGAPKTRGVHVQILAINDFHGHLEPPTAAEGGIAYLATHVKRLEAGLQHAYFVGAGDLIGGSPMISGYFHDDPAIEALNLAGLDLTAVGNHEFDEGSRELNRMRREASFEYLGANVLRAGEPLMPGYEIEDVEGIKLAFIGLTLEDTPSVTRPDGVAGLEFRPEVATVNGLVRRLRREQGVRAFAVLVHEGGEQRSDDPNACDGLTGAIVPIVEALDDDVDIVASAHTHEAYVCRVDGKALTSAGSFGRLITDIDLRLSRRSHDVTDVDVRNVTVSHDVPKDPAETALVNRYAARVAPVADRVVATAAADVSRTQLGTTIADAAREATGAAVAFVTPGGIRAGLDAGDVTYGDLFEVLPFGDGLVVATLTGAQVNRLLDSTLLASGVGPFDPGTNYPVAVNSFLAAGGDGFSVFRRATTRRSAGADLDALVAYVGRHSPL